MFLKRVHIHDFRVLKDVELVFEPEFTPTIYPLGSLNGGGKSTLLQLIFILLRCSFDESKRGYLANILVPIKKDYEGTLKLFEFYLIDNQREFTLEFSLIKGKIDADKINNLNKDLLHITHFSLDDALYCRTTVDSQSLKNLSKKIYLAAPSTQVFLFLSDDEKKMLFSTKNSRFGEYSDAVDRAKKDLEGLFTYDFASVDFIVNAFKKARDKDFEEALVSGHYGNHLKQLKIDLNNFLPNKNITIDKKLSRVIFKLKDSNEELFPEDLSHGELKKLAIYIWLKSCDMEDALILMDEIEIGLHPDWQYEIINELQEWSNNNQFILATHSYELCQALTPSHVKELEPKLL